MNQDAFLDRPDIGLWAVADGMGGHASGERASKLVVEALAQLPVPELLGRSVRHAECLIAEANRRLIDEANASGDEIIGTTVVVLLAMGGACALLWVGDSRIYRLRDDRLEQLTRDHTEVQQWVSEGKLSAEQAESHPYAGVLSRAVGAEDEIQVDSVLEPLMGGDRYLLCSDGLTKELTLERIEQLLGSGEPPEVVQALVQNACAAGGRDNVTAVVVDFLNR
ncbi:PP2C family protein-serine/threonine phosphatase [Thiocapsa bogorovii]|uniref:PP2C family protein-serine/threonine phosphatase n=1 Tax=Thiocapsa bogorovii TaxID=521689 RepID=UPI001E38729D|nr:protein phosphatase 2C domain-containing protein [Thiocapsa bogorovii]UHD16100.1 protein phosphatase 2C domain-containing protein [Thiocapsa bogorovii]